ncbi:ArsR/SmtB family transcription factor [Qipengyuania sp. ASV99]|uniref:ArsR/SmtB family transcription factor n=1 Tax=Qipengyuania sp. ASV99 TaxID=3399681 RepID=UPI003A4C5E59
MEAPGNQRWAVEALGALAHETRLSVFRALVQAGADGMIAGAIADRQHVPPSTMSHHLAALERAGLVQSARESRLIHYTADYAAMRRLLTFLMEDCCQGAPEMCGDMMGALFAGRDCLAPSPVESRKPRA